MYKLDVSSVVLWTRATAQAMLDLIDYLIEYIYTLPGMIEELNRKVQQLDRELHDRDAGTEGQEGSGAVN